MNVHLIDGTYELFRHFFAVPPAADVSGQEIGAVRGVLHSVLSMIDRGATHIGVATDHVIESFRNELYAGYKTSEGVPPELLSQFPILEEGLEAMGVVVWRVVHLDRRRETIRDEAGVIAKFGVKPESIPDYLAVVGDSADGFPGVMGWGQKSAALVLSQYVHLENIPKDFRNWHPSIRSALKLSTSLSAAWEDALLFRTLATLRLDVPVFETVGDLRWMGPRASLEEQCHRMRSPDLLSRATSASKRLHD